MSSSSAIRAARPASKPATSAYDYTVLAGTQGAMNHQKKDRILKVAEEWKLPVVCFAEGGGGRPGDTDFPGVAVKDVQFLFLKGKLAKISFGTAATDCKAVHDAFERDYGTAQKHVTAPM